MKLHFIFLLNRVIWSHARGDILPNENLLIGNAQRNRKQGTIVSFTWQCRFWQSQTQLFSDSHNVMMSSFNHILVVWGLLIYNRFVKGKDFRSSSFSCSRNDFAVIISLDPFSATLVAVFLTRFESALNYCYFLFKNSGILILRNMLRSYFSFSYVCRSNQAGLFLIICNYFNKVYKNINPNNVSEF